MATRCNVIVRVSDASTVYLYRHWDGYPALTGADLAEHAKAHREPAAFVAGLLAQKRGGDGSDAERGEYELTNDIHGDVEWIYEFRREDEDSFKGTPAGWRVVVRERINFERWQYHGEWTLLAFVGLMVKPAIERMNDRIKAMQADSEPLPVPDPAAFA